MKCRQGPSCPERILIAVRRAYGFRHGFPTTHTRFRSLLSPLPLSLPFTSLSHTVRPQATLVKAKRALSHRSAAATASSSDTATSLRRAGSPLLTLNGL